MSPKITELLQRFQRRANEPALKGQLCQTTEAFQLAAVELELAIRESGLSAPKSALISIPSEYVLLVHEALHFSPHSEADWEALGMAAMAVQNGAPS